MPLPDAAELSPTDTGTEHKADPRSSKSDGGKPRSFGKLKGVHYPIRASGDTASDLGDVTLRRAELVHGATTGESVKFDKFPEDRKREDQGLEVDIKAETVEKYYNFLDTYVTNLGKLAEQPPPPGVNVNNLLEYVLRDPDKRGDKLVMDLLSEKAVGKDGKTIAITVNAEKARDYLKSADGWAETTMMMEQYALWAQLGLGIKASVDEPRYNRQSNGDIDDRKTILNEDIKTLRGLVKSGVSRGLLGAGAALYWLGGRGKTNLEMEAHLQLLDALKTDASDVDRAYLRVMTGVDIDRITVTAAGGGLTAEYDDGYQPNVRATESAVTNAYAARKEFLKQLGIDEPDSSVLGRKIDRTRDIRTPDEAIFFDNIREEGLNMRYTMEISKEYGDIMAAFVGTPDRYDRARAKADAREKVRVRYAERRIAMEQTRKEEGALDALKAKKQQMESNADTFRKQRAEEHTKKKEEAQKKKDEAEAKKKTLTEGSGSAAAKEQAVLNKERDLLRDFGLPLNTDIETAVQTEITKLRTELATAEGKLDKALENKAADARKLVIDDIMDPLRKDLAAYATTVAGSSAKTIAAPPSFDVNAIAAPGLEALNNRYDTAITRLTKTADAAEQRLDNLEAQYQAYRQAAGERDTVTVELAAAENDQFQNAADAIDTFVGGVTPLATVAEVRTKSVDELTALLPTGTDPEKVQLALLAKATEEADRVAALSTYQQAAITELSTAGVQADEILTRSRREMFDRLEAHHIAVGTTPMPTAAEMSSRIEVAYLAAGRQMRVLNESRLNQDIAYYDGVVKVEDKSLETLGDFKGPLGELSAAITMMEEAGEGHTYSRLYEVADDEAELRKLVDVTTVPATDTTYSEAERKQAAEKGIYAWYEMLYPEYKNATNRDDIFEALTRVLPPDKLANLIAEGYYNLAPGVTIPTNIIFGAIEIDIAGGIVTGPRLQQTVRYVLDHVRDHGLAL